MGVERLSLEAPICQRRYTRLGNSARRDASLTTEKGKRMLLQ